MKVIVEVETTSGAGAIVISGFCAKGVPTTKESAGMVSKGGSYTLVFSNKFEPMPTNKDDD